MRKTMIGSICALTISAIMLAPHPVGAEEASASPQTKLAASCKEIRLETTSTRNQLQTAVKALDALTKQRSGDLRPAYATFCDEVKKTHAAAEQTRSRTGSMETASKDYFGTWQIEIAGIANASLRKRAQERLADVRKNYDKTIVSLREAGEPFKPFLSNLDDVQKALANDITTGGVKAIRGVASDAVWNERKVRRYVNDAIEHLADMEKDLSPKKTD